jgi:hypothetical protein
MEPIQRSDEKRFDLHLATQIAIVFFVGYVTGDLNNT